MEVGGEVPVEIADLDGIQHFALALRVGMTEMWGGNAHGKTRVQAAVADAAASTRKTQVSMSDLRRDGSDGLVGSVSVGGRTLEISRSGSVSRRGKMLAGLRIVDPGPVSRLIDPGLIEEEAKRVAQLRALLELVPLDVTRENLEAVCVDEEVLRDALEDAEQNKLENMLEAVRRMRIAVQAKARELEADAKRRRDAEIEASGRLDGLLRAGVDAVRRSADAREAEGAKSIGDEEAKSLLLGLPSYTEEMQRARIDAERKLATLRAESAAAEAALAHQAELRGRLGKPPDTKALNTEKEAAEAGRKDAEEALADAARKVVEAQEALAVARERFEHREDELEAAKKREEAAADAVRGADLALAEWRKLKETIEEEIVGPSAEDLSAAEREAVTRGIEVELAAMADRCREAAAEVESQRQYAAEATKRAEELREVERRAWERLGELVTRATKVPEITIQSGYVAYVAPDGSVHDWNSKYVSTGQRNAAAFRLGARCFGKGSVLMIAGSVWETLDLEAKLELHRVCREEEVYGLTEVASFSGDPLRSVYVGTREWVDSYRSLLEAAVAATAGGK